VEQTQLIRVQRERCPSSKLVINLKMTLGIIITRADEAME
jgi:hypothetical protein